MVTYSLKSSSNRGIQIKGVPKKDVMPFGEPEDSNRCGEESEIGDKSADEAVEKGKQAKVVIALADSYEIFRVSTSDNDSVWKSMMKTVKFKKKGNNSDIVPNKQDNEVAVRDLQIDIPDKNAIVEYVETDKDGRHNEIIYMWEHPWIQKIGQYQKIPPPRSIPEETYAENSSTEIVAVADVHGDAPLVEDTRIYDEPPKEIPKTVKKGAKSSAKELRKRPNLTRPKFI